MPDHLLEAIALVLALATKKLWDHLAEKRKSKTKGDPIARGFDGLSRKIDEKTGELRADIAEVRAFCVGPDGKNGFRKDIENLTGEVQGLVQRERERLERQVGKPDRRRA